MNGTTSIAKISAALVKAQVQMGAATKDSKNPFFKSSYATLNAIREAVMPALSANGIVVLQPMKILEGRTIIETILLHESGEYLSSETPVVVAKQNDPQAEGSGQSYARRYGLQSFLNVGSVDDDGEAAMGRVQRPAPTVTSAPTTQVSGATSSPAPVTTEAPKKTSSFRKPVAATSSPAVIKPSELPNVSTQEGWE